mmetsp:Transcript_3913/g.15586  ORF Transcript_3913/g.15586 Transcript_3913/m.15586 type:complete len:85 (+) Transcript_3913:1528-1782(+)
MTYTTSRGGAGCSNCRLEDSETHGAETWGSCLLVEGSNTALGSGLVRRVADNKGDTAFGADDTTRESGATNEVRGDARARGWAR